MGLGYVDDMAILAVANSFEDMHCMLKGMINHEEGMDSWAAKHTSRFEAMKLVLMDFSHNEYMDHPPMTW